VNLRSTSNPTASRFVRGAVSLSLALQSLASVGLAQEPSGTAAPTTVASSTTVDESLAQARDLISNGNYDGAIELLRPALPASSSTTEKTREVYLLLAESYFYLGNSIKLTSRASAQSNYDKGRSLIRELLSVPQFSHAQPGELAPPEMKRAFREVRGELFGSLRVNVQPVSATVTLDGDTLRTVAGEPDGVIGADDLMAGPHTLLVCAPGYRDFAPTVTIVPGTIVNPTYQLDKKRNRRWYYGGATLAVIAGTTIALSAANGSDATVEQPLPGPPDPPAR